MLDALCYTAATLYALFSTVSVALFYRFRHVISIHHRGIPITLLYAISSSVIVVVYLLREPTRTTFPCWIVYWTSVLMLPLSLLALAARLIRLLFLHRTSEAYSVAHWLRKHKSAQAAASSAPDAAAEADDAISYVDMNVYTRNRRYFSAAYLLYAILAILTLYFIPLLTMQLTDPSLQPVPDGQEHGPCGVGTASVPAYVLTGLIIFILFPVLLYLLKDVRDAYGIKRELLVSLCIWMFTFLLYFITTFGTAAYHRGSFVLVGGHVLTHLVLVVYPVLRVLQNKGRKPDKEEGTKQAFHELWEDPLLLEQLKVYAVKDFSIENVLFYEQCLQVKRFPFRNHSHMVKAYDGMYELFFGEDAPMLLNVSAKTLKQVRARHKEYPEDLYQEAQKEIEYLIYSDTYAKFLRTSQTSVLPSPPHSK